MIASLSGAKHLNDGLLIVERTWTSLLRKFPIQDFAASAQERGGSRADTCESGNGNGCIKSDQRSIHHVSASGRKWESVPCPSFENGRRWASTPRSRRYRSSANPTLFMLPQIAILRDVLEVFVLAFMSSSLGVAICDYALFCRDAPVVQGLVQVLHRRPKAQSDSKATNNLINRRPRARRSKPFEAVQLLYVYSPIDNTAGIFIRSGDQNSIGI